MGLTASTPKDLLVIVKHSNGKNVTASTDSLEAITEKDRELIQLLIEQPTLTDAQIARKLGVSRQAVTERRKNLNTKASFNDTFIGTSYLDLSQPNTLRSLSTTHKRRR